MTAAPSLPDQITTRRILHTWWPLAASWLLMGIELPAVSATMARLAFPKINLAAYGGVVFPLSLIIEAPVIMMLAASTALCKDWISYLKIRRFMMILSASLTILHILIAFTPLYYVIVDGIIDAPPVIIEPARIGLMIMLPWTWSIAYRRFNQGVLIRFGHSRSVGIGTVIRLTADGLVLLAGYFIGSIPGIVVATSAVIAGVLSEAFYSGIAVRPIVNGPLKIAPAVKPPINLRSFLDFYIPLAMTSLLLLMANPIGSAALSRMPSALDSLAVWPVINGLIFMFRTPGVAYNEVVVALLDEPRSSSNLRKFAIVLSLVTSGLLLIIVITPLAKFWLEVISALTPELSSLAQSGIWFVLLVPGLSVWQSWYQGVIVHSRRTRGITEAVVLYLITSVVLLGLGVLWGQTTGLIITLIVLTISVAVQTLWLWFRARPTLKSIDQVDAVEPILEGISS